MNKLLVILAALLFMTAAPVFTQGRGDAQPPASDIVGEWTVSIGPRRPIIFRGALAQKGGALSGYMGDEAAEYPVTGTITGAQVRILWSIYNGGEKLPIVFTGTLDRDVITGGAKVGDAQEVESFAQRTAR